MILFKPIAFNTTKPPFMRRTSSCAMIPVSNCWNQTIPIFQMASFISNDSMRVQGRKSSWFTTISSLVTRKRRNDSCNMTCGIRPMRYCPWSTSADCVAYGGRLAVAWNTQCRTMLMLLYRPLVGLLMA